MSAAGAGICCSSYVQIVALVGIIISSVALAAGCSLHAVSVGGVVTGVLSPLGLPQFIVSILGLTGVAGINTVAGVTLGFSVFTFMIGSCASYGICCSKGKAG